MSSVVPMSSEMIYKKLCEIEKDVNRLKFRGKEQNIKVNNVVVE